MRTYGLIPAAGKSRRMGQPKLLLPVAGKSVLEHVVAALRLAGVVDVLVVTAPNGDELVRVAEGAGAQVLRLTEDTPDMRATCLHGLAWIEKHWQPAAHDGWLLLPADHPTVRPDIVHALRAATLDDHGHSIFVPSHGGRRGHPTWIRWSHLNALRALPAEVCLNQFIRAHSVETREILWPSDEILRDLDTPEDYRQLLGE